MPTKVKKNLENLRSKTKLYLAIIFLLLVIICVMHAEAIAPSIICYAILVYYSVWTNKKRLSELSTHIQDLVLDVDTAAKRTLINSPFPLIIIETNGNVIWKSTKFIKEFINIDINTYLDGLIMEIKQEIADEKNKDKVIEKKMSIGEKSYKVIGEYVKSKVTEKKKEYTMTLYFIDETEELNLKKENEDLRTCVRNHNDR